MLKLFLSGGCVELRMSGCGAPPGFKGQATASSSCWFRENGGEWEPASSRSMHKNMQALECADNAAEFRQLLEII